MRTGNSILSLGTVFLSLRVCLSLSLSLSVPVDVYRAASCVCVCPSSVRIHFVRPPALRRFSVTSLRFFLLLLLVLLLPLSLSRLLVVVACPAA